LKNNFNKIKNKSKEWESNWKKTKQQKLWLNDEIESQKNFKWERGLDGPSIETMRG